MTTFSLDPANFTIILTWLFTTIKDNIVPPLFEADRGISTATFAEYMFYEQWANGTMLGEEMFPGGLDFSDFIEELVGPVIGFEVGLPPNPSNISFTSAKALWDISNPYSFINTTTGFGSWYLAGVEKNETIESLLNATFGLASGQIELIIDWLFNTVKKNIVPPFFALPEALGGKGMSTTEYSKLLFYEQWANCTVVPGGLDLGGGLKGFEVNCTVPTNISLTITRDLWDPTSSSSFINDTGLQTWLAALTNDTIAE